MKFRAIAFLDNFEKVMTTESAALERAAYGGDGESKNAHVTNSTELIAAACAASFSTALAAELRRIRAQPHTITVTSIATLEKLSQGWTVSHVILDVVANVPEVSAGDFISAAVRAKLTCPICRLLNTCVSMNARLRR